MRKFKYIALIVAVLISMSMFGLSACSNSASNAENNQSASSDSSGDTETDGTKSIVVTIFPEYDWVREIIGENPGGIDLTLLLDSGVDLHNYQPTAQDILKISTCDLFIYVGGESDEWVEDALEEAVNADMKVIDLLDELGDLVKEEELVEGMEEEEEDDEEGEEEEVELDEHVWLSLRNAEVLSTSICNAISEIDPDNQSTYESNLNSYMEKLQDLDQKYQDMVSTSARKVFLFGDRFPFRYMSDDYGIEYYAAFAGCSAETEASFETITFLANKVDELNLPYVLTIEGTNHKIAETIISTTENRDQEVLVMDSLQACTAETIDSGETYLGIMEKNLEVLTEALN